MTLLCSPTDRDLLSILKTMIPTISNLLPERYGADVLHIDRDYGRLAIQRKTYIDFLASLYDGRLTREVTVLRTVEYPVLMLELWPEWTSDGHMLEEYNSRMTKARLRNLLRSVSIINGIHVERTDDINDTATAIVEMVKWYTGSHISLDTRPKRTRRDDWGKVDSKSAKLFILQGFPGIGSVLAEQILDHFGKLPLGWSCTKDEMREVQNIGEKRVEQLWKTLI